MRVYGSSPLYNYLELCFRSKRLFIAAIVLATLTTASIATLRAGTYTATAFILLSGTQQTGSRTPDENQMGGIKYKFNVLNVLLKNPEFFKQAFRAAKLDKNMTEIQFDTFCKDARQALTIATGENSLELTCRWPGPQAADIINAFYHSYSNRVLGQETVLSESRTRLLRSLLEEYTRKEQKVEQEVIAWRQQHFNVGALDLDQAIQKYDDQYQKVKELEDQLMTRQLSLNQVREELAQAPPTLVEPERQGSTQSSDYQALLMRKRQVTGKLSNDLAKYTDQNPAVVADREQINRVNADLKRLDTDNTANGAPFTRKTITNPEYARLKNEYAAVGIQTRGLEGEYRNDWTQLEKYRQAVQTAAPQQYEYKRIRENLKLYTAIRENLASKLQAAIIAEKQERGLHLSEMIMTVTPKSERDTAGVNSLLFYAAGPLLGLVIAFAFSLLAGSLDHSLRTPVDVEKYLGKPVLAVLPRMDR